MPLALLPAATPVGSTGHALVHHPIIHQVLNTIIAEQANPGAIPFSNSDGDLSFDATNLIYDDGTDTLTVENLDVNGTLTATITGGGVSGIAVGGVTFGSGTGTLTTDVTNLSFNDTNNQLLLGNGSAANPSYSFVNATTTGLVWASATSEVGVVVGASTKLRVASGGNVSINVNSNVDRTLLVSGTSPNTGSTPIGVFSDVTFPAASNVSGTAVAGRVNTAATAFTMPDAYAFRAVTPVAGAGSTITNGYGYYSPAIAGATNNYTARFDASATQTLWVGGSADSTTAAAGIAFGSSRDTNLYRSTSSHLRTDGSLGVGGTNTFLSRLFAAPNTSTAGSSSTRIPGLYVPTGTINFTGGTGQTGNVVASKVDGLTVTADTASVIPDLIGFHAVGAIPSTNVTATRSQAVLVQPGRDANVGVAIRQNSGSQSADLLQLQNSAGTTISAIGAAGQFWGINGTAGGPSFSFASDQDTGMFRATTNILGFSTGGTERYRVTDEGALLLGVQTNAGIWFRIGGGATHPDTTSSVDVHGIHVDYTIPTTGTTSAAGYAGRLRTSAAAYTVALATFVRANSPTLGAGSTITNARAIQVDNWGAAEITQVRGLHVAAQSGSTTNITAAFEASAFATIWCSSNADNTNVAAGIQFGTSRDTNLYRGAADLLRTDDSLTIAGAQNLSARLTITPQTSIAGSATSVIGGTHSVGTTLNFTGGSGQTGNVAHTYLAQLTLTAATANTIPDVAGLWVIGTVPSTNVTATRSQAVLVQTGANANAGISIRQNSGSQTGNLITFADSAGTGLSAIGANGHFRILAGTAAGPGLQFVGDADNGIYLIGPDNMGLSVGGGKVIDLSTTSIKLTKKLYFVEDDGAEQTASGMYAGTGAPNNANGADGDFYFRSDGGALTTIYQRRAGAWVGII